MKTEIIYGIHPVFEALTAGKRTFHTLYVIKDKASQRIEDIVEMTRPANIPVEYLPRQKFNALTGIDTHQGVAALVSPFPLLDLSDLLGENSTDNKSKFFLLIDNIVDPHNLGALIRSALCASLTGVIIPKDRAAEPSPTVSKSSAGALEHIRLASVVNMANAIKELKKSGMWIIGLDKDGERSIYENDFTGNIALVVGGEESGIRPLVKKNCDFLSFIPQNGPVSSLNASVAGAVAMYEAYRQRCFSS